MPAPDAPPGLAIGALASGYVNANNIGLPIAVYVLGNAAYVAPVLLLQLLVFAPVALTVRDVTSHGAVSVKSILTQPIRNPMIIAFVVGVIVAITGVPLLKSAIMPVVAYIAARLVLQLDGHELLAAVMLAALPTAQNVYNFASRYERGEVLARDTVLVSTILAIPVLVVIAALLA